LNGTLGFWTYGVTIGVEAEFKLQRYTLRLLAPDAVPNGAKCLKALE
jgi:hypothetical protein